MDDAQRRSEILQAEEAVRMLAEEMGKAKSAESAAEEVHTSLKRAVDVVTRAGEGVSEAGRAQLALAKTSEKAIEAAGQDNKRVIDSATTALEACLHEVQTVCEQFQTTAGGLSEQSQQRADVLAGRIERLETSVSALAEGVSGVQTLAKAIETRVADLHTSQAQTNTAMAEMKEEVRANPTQLAGQVRRSITKRMGILVYVLVFSMLSLVGTGAVIWLLVVILAEL